jgi:hypothetical protein
LFTTCMSDFILIRTCFTTYWISLGWSTLNLSGEIICQMFSS